MGITVLGVTYYWHRSSESRPFSRSQAYDPKTGLGRGAPGFQTNVRRVAVPPEIMARIRAGEDVSAEEITKAQEQLQREEERRLNGDSGASSKRKKRSGKR